jgi:TRAP-type C4-dicarboxylate transport system permease small subunit
MATVVAMMLLTVADVFLRYVFSAPIIGVTEITEVMMVCLLLGMAACAMEKRHIKVDIVIAHSPPKVVVLMDLITMLMGFALTIGLIWEGYQRGLFELRYGVESSMLKIPVFPFYIVLAVSFIILFIAMVVIFINRIRELKTL